MDIRREIELVLKARDESLSRVTKTATASVGGIEKAVGGLQKILATAGIAVGLQSIMSQYKAVVDQVSRFADLGGRLSIAASTLSALDVVAGDSGASVDDLAQAMRFLGVNTSKGNETLKALIGDLGALRSMRPEDAFVKVAEAVRAIPNQNDRMRAAVEIFGRGGAVVLQLSGNMGELVEQARMLGLVFGDKLVADVDATGDSLARLDRRVQVLKASLAERIGLGRMIDQMIAGLAPREHAEEAWRAYYTKYGVGAYGARRDFTMTGAKGYQALPPGMGYTGEGAPLFPGMSPRLKFPDEGKEEKQWDGKAWMEGYPDVHELVTKALARAREEAEMIREGAGKTDQRLQDEEDSYQEILELQHEAVVRAEEYKRELSEARTQALEGLVGGFLQLGAVTGSSTQRWYQGLQKVYAMYQAIRAIAMAVNVLSYSNPTKFGLPIGPTSPVPGAGLAQSPAPGGLDQASMAVAKAGAAGYIDPFSLRSGGGRGGLTMIQNVGRPIGRLDGLDMGAAAYAAQKEFERRIVG